MVKQLFVALQPFELAPTEILGLTAKQVVEKALQFIPHNYSHENYAYYSFYREYQKVNERFKNLIEAKAVVMIRPFREKKKLAAEEAFAIQSMRRSYFHRDIEDMETRNGFQELIGENPIYHIDRSSFMPFIFERCSFHFDSISTEEDYVINYSCPNSGDSHGIGDNAARNFFGESYEKGKLVINRTTFAFKRIERKSFRNKHYNYSRANNFLLPNRNYTGEFSEGYFIAEFMPLNKKWFLKSIRPSNSILLIRGSLFRRVRYVLCSILGRACVDRAFWCS